MKRIFFLLLSVFLCGCISHRYHLPVSIIDEKTDTSSQSLPQVPPIYYEGFASIPLSNDDIFTLSEKQKSDFLDYYHARKNSDVKANRRVANYINDFSKDFHYMGDTLNASQAIEQQSGNCLTLAIVSTAFAQLANLRYKYKKVHSAPVYQEYGDVQLVSSHLNFTMYNNPNLNNGLDLSNIAVTIDYFNSSTSTVTVTVPNDEILIMYWHNLASEALINKNIDLAFAYTVRANSVQPNHPETLNLFAILYRRIGKIDLAYKVYEYLVSSDMSTFTIVDNFASLLDARGENKRAASLRSQIKHLIDDNPYTWLYRGKLYIENNELALAEQYFLKSTEFGPYLHEPKFYLARVYAKQNKMMLAKKALKQAHELAYLPDDIRRYKAKLHGLESD